MRDLFSVVAITLRILIVYKSTAKVLHPIEMRKKNSLDKFDYQDYQKNQIIFIDYLVIICASCSWYLLTSGSLIFTSFNA